MNKVFGIAPHVVEFCTLPSTCAYLDVRKARMEYRYIKGCSFNLNDKLVRNGWRRFGEYFSRPQCKNCDECKSLRIDAQNFTFSRSAKRSAKKNKNTSTVTRIPSVTKEHVKLYNKYHKFMQTKKGWKHFELSLQSYYELYVNGHEYFATLGCKDNDSFAVVRSKYLRLVKMYHPDHNVRKNTLTVEHYREKFEKIQIAYEIVKAYYTQDEIGISA